MRRYGSATHALEMLPHLAARGGKTNYVICPEEDAQAEMEAARAIGARLLLIGDPEYPRLLRTVEPAPPALWALGDIGLLNRRTVAMVGARNASALGIRTARRLARELGSLEFVIVSGLARGIDAAAHEAALLSGTIAVLAGGLDCPYPAENQELCQQIAEKGLLITEMPFGMVPAAPSFPRRNRIISGLSEGVVLIEAAARSGSLITARFALDQGREAMACPGAAEDPRSEGCNAMIREGAALIRHAGDVSDALTEPREMALAEDSGDFEFDAEIFSETTMRDDYDALTDFDEEGGMADDALADQIMDLLGHQAVEIDELARQIGTSPSDLSLAILELDLAGRIHIRPGGMVVRAYDE